MPYLNLDLNYFEHRKTRRLIGLLGRGAEVLPIRLWSYCGKFHCEDGRLAGYSEQEIESIVQWWGKPGEMLVALEQAGFVEKNGKTWVVVSFLEHQGHIAAFKVRGRAAAEARWAHARSVTSNATSMLEVCLSNAPTVPTKPTKPTNQTNRPREAPKAEPEPAPDPKPEPGVCVEGAGTMQGAKRKFEVDTRVEWLSRELAKVYHRPRPELVSCIEQGVMAELARRPDLKTELAEIVKFRERMPDKRYFPQSMLALMESWDKTLDKARGEEHAPGAARPTNGVQLRVYADEMDRCLQRIRTIKSGYSEHQNYSEDDRRKLKELFDRRKELRVLLGVKI